MALPLLPFYVEVKTFQSQQLDCYKNSQKPFHVSSTPVESVLWGEERGKMQITSFCLGRFNQNTHHLIAPDCVLWVMEEVNISLVTTNNTTNITETTSNKTFSSGTFNKITHP